MKKELPAMDKVLAAFWVVGASITVLVILGILIAKLLST